jgi:hypothetical protein
MRQTIRGLLLVGSIAALLTACSPSPTPSPTSTVTVEAAARAYSTFLEIWRGTYADTLNTEAPTAGGDATKIAQYARALRDAYQAFGRGAALIDVPEGIRPALDAEVQAVNTLVDLATRLADEPSNPALNTELGNALGRVTQTTAAVEAALRIFH